MAKKLSKRARKQIINIAVLLILIGVTFVVIFTSQDINIHDIGNFLYNCNPWYIVGAVGGLLGYILFEAISLHIIARKLGHKSKFTSSVAYSTSDLYYSAITPSASGGQPASAYYMMRDGMSGGTAGFTVLFNIISYTVATILVGLFGVIAAPAMFGEIGHWLAKTLVIVGFVIQLLLLALLLLCLFRARIILKIGGWGIKLLTKIKIIKKPDKWYSKLDNMVIKYRSCRSVIKKHPMLFFNALLLNTAQRVSQTLIPCFVIMASPEYALSNVSFLELFCMQAYVMIGYNSIPLPGGTGVYEYLYPNIFGIGFTDMTFVLSAMMVSRGISYYLSMVVTGVYTLIYHAVGIKNIKEKKTAAAVPDDVDVYTALKSESVLSAIAVEDSESERDQAKEKPKKRKGETDTNTEQSEQAAPQPTETVDDGQAEQAMPETDTVPAEQSAQIQSDAESKDANDD